MADTTNTEPKHSTYVHTHGEPKASLVSNALAIVGFIIVIVIVLWGLFHIATLGMPWLSSLFGGGSQTITVEAPENVTSGTAFAINWKYSNSEQGTYAFLYQCKDVLHFQTTNAGGTMDTIPCGAAFTLATTGNTLMVTPQLSGTASTSVPLTIVFIPSATTSPQVQGNTTVTVNPVPPPVVVTPVTPTPVTPVPTPAQPVATGPTDLSVQIISVVPDGSGGAIATFDIGNEELSSTGTYSFTAQLPTTNGYLYQSPTQSSLAPGDHIVNTLRFSQAVSGTFSVVVDPTNSKNELSTANNYASQQISMPYVQQTYQTYPQQYSPYPQYPYVY